MSTPDLPRVGSALIWKGVQLFGGKAISLVRILVLARLLAPEEFGLLAIAAVVIELLMAVTTLGTSEALVQRDRVGRRDYDTAWTLEMLRALVVAVLVVVSAPLVAEMFGEPRATPFLQVLGLRPLVDAAASVRLVDLTRSLQMQSVALMRVSSSAIDTLGTILLVLFLPPLLVDAAVSVALVQTMGVWALVVGAFAGSLSTTVLSYVIAPYRPRLCLDRRAFMSLIGFGKWLLVTGVVGIVGHLALRAIISQRLGTTELGIFYLALKLTLLPNDLAGEVIRSVTFPVVAKARGDIARVRRAFRAAVTAMLAVLMPAYVCMIALSDSVTKHILGEQWHGLAPVIALLAVDGIVDIVADATKPLLLGLGRPHARALIKGVRVAVLVGLAWWLTGEWGVAGAAVAWVVAESVQGVVAVVMARRALPHPFSGLTRGLVVIAAASIAGGVVGWWIDWMLPGLAGLIAGAVAALGLSGLLLLVLDRLFALGLASDFARAFPAVATRLSLVAESR